MGAEYSVEVCRELQERSREARLHRPERISRYDAGSELVYDVRGVGQAGTARVRLAVERFVGGGFAGQVYRVKVLGIDPDDGSIDGLEVGKVCAIKILIPPSGFSRLFRNLLYWIGFQGPFQLQVNPAAAQAGALWQKLIRRGAGIKFGDQRSVIDIYATFVDDKLGSCGELREWVEGRTWQLEVDDRLDLLKRWRRGKAVDEQLLGSPEYRAKREFMRRFVELLHEMGAHEFARQYEWSTCKSQPNCLKRADSEGDPSGGLVAVDFRAGLALLPFLPMSPGDFKLIAKGLTRGSLVQFDRGSLGKLEEFVEAHPDHFADMGPMLEELKEAERIYRNSIPDITHNHVKLLYSRNLWATMLDSAVTGWKVRNLVDAQWERRLRGSKILTLLFLAVGLIPFLGRTIRRTWGCPDWRKHYGAILTSWGYFRRALRARIAEKVIVWHRAGRVDGERAHRIAEETWRFWCHWPISILPAKLHRFLTDRQFRKQKLVYIFVRPFRLYFFADVREQWLREMVSQGRRKHILSEEDANTILSQVNEPFIQKYLKSLAVHVCTLPVTQIVSVLVAWLYVRTHPELSTQGEAVAVTAILLLFQIMPVSPGSLVRGLYVLYLVIREWNFKDYNIAVMLGFFKYIGYLAFPIQMTHHYPALARFMAGHWATEATHIVPVFGERGALLEHVAFCLFYNWPLTIRRRMRRRAEIRAEMKPRYWHVGLVAIVAAGVFGVVDVLFFSTRGELPSLKDMWWLVVTVPLACGAVATLGCGGARFARRIIAAAACGAVSGIFYTVASAMVNHVGEVTAAAVAASCVWRVFVFAILSAAGAMAAELKLPDPDLK